MLSSEEMNGERFSVVRRGYDMSEVESYLGTREKEWSADLATAKSKISELEAALTEARSKEEAVHLTLLAATKTKDEMVGAAQRALDEATTKAEAQAEKIVSDAKFEAYRLVNEAKELSDRALAEAKADAEAAASTARREAEAELAALRQESARLREERERELADMKRRFEEEHGATVARVAQLRSVANDLEHRLRALAAGNLDAITEISAALGSHPSSEGTTADATTAAASEYTAARREPYQPDEEEGDQPRGSFYSRRSARLPRIGDDAANGVLAAVGAMRARVIEADEGPHDFDEEDAEAPIVEPDMAAQTA